MNKEEAIKYLQQLYPNGGHCWLDEQRIEAIGVAVKALQEEPVNEELEEASEEYAYELFPSIGVANTEIELAFKAGAQWQKKKTINKACAWLEENYDSGRYMPNDAGEYRGKEGFIEDFVNDLGKGE